MRYLIFLLMLVSLPAIAAPFLVSDPDSTGAADKCVYQRGTAAPVETPVAAVPPSVIVGSCKIDLAGFPTGTSNLQVWFKSSVWGVESAKVPFVLSKPAAIGPGPTNLRVEP